MSSKKPAPKSDNQKPTQDMASEYLLLIRNTAWQKDFSAAEIEKILSEFSAWVTRLKDEGTIKVAVPLVHQGKLFDGKDVMVDGPFIESKEAIAGLIIFEAESFEAAVELANSATCLNYGQKLELRPIATEEPERTALRAKS
ncbi:MAG: hypothetical protein JO025_07085 [Verrucomicrobia bacterium]|nr:hypothetical protein [Verrucomicrobiota bacterium]